MKIAVTGATGFVGRHVVAELLRRGESPLLVLRPGTALPAEFARCAVARVDLAQPPADAHDQLGRPDMLIHLAWGGLPNFKSARHVQEELPAHLRFIAALVNAGLPALLATGTCLEYGMRQGALREDMEPQPHTPYGQAKDRLRRDIERMQQERMASGRPFAFTWARLFYLHGEGQAPNSLWPQLHAAAARGDATFNMSGGEQLRDYLPMREAAALLVTLALDGRDAGVVNLCHGEPISVRSLVQGWIDGNGWSIRPQLGHYPYPDYEPMAFWGDRRKLDSLLGPR